MVDLPIAFYVWFWRALLLGFFIVESLAILDPKPGDTLTESVRPLVHAHPLIWFLFLGAGLWLLVHFLTPGLERWLADSINARWR